MIERLARLGYASKGLVYAIIGLFTAAAGLGVGGGTPDRRAAFTFVLHQPFGHSILLIVAIGLAGYAIWRVICGVRDTEHRGNDAKALAIRAGSVIRGVVYGWVAIEVARLALRKGSGGSGSDAQTRHWAARAMDKPFGQTLLAIAGLAILGYGVYQMYRGAKGKLGKQAHIPRGALTTISRFGMAARGAVFMIIGSSLGFAATRHDPGQARGTSGALRELAAQPFGSVLLTIVGLGLLAYGVYAFLNARYRDIDV
jgi:hypothetical protein